MNDANTSPYPVWGRFEFHGKAGEYFSIWIVNIALTVVTLGIYSAWAKVRRERYFYGNTVVHGSHFDYTANPLTILRGRVISVLALILFYVLLLAYPQWSLWVLAALAAVFPFVLVTSTSFRLRNTRYRNIRFRFDRDYAGAYRLFAIPLGIVIAVTALLYGLWENSDLLLEMEQQLEESGEGDDYRREDMLFTLFFLTLLPLLPYLQYAMRRFLIDRSHFGSADGSFHTGAGEFYVIYVLLFAFASLASIAFALVVVGVGAVVGTIPGIADGGEEATAAAVMMVVVPIVIVFYGFGFYFLGFLNSRLANLTWNNTRLGPLELHSTQRARDLGTIYLTNTLAILFSLGFAIPWSQIRITRYRAEHTEVLARDLEAVRGITVSEEDAVGEELGEVFDLDLGL